MWTITLWAESPAMNLWMDNRNGEKYGAFCYVKCGSKNSGGAKQIVGA
jgi:hypothetical protein